MKSSYFWIWTIFLVCHTAIRTLAFYSANTLASINVAALSDNEVLVHSFYVGRVSLLSKNYRQNVVDLGPESTLVADNSVICGISSNRVVAINRSNWSTRLVYEGQSPLQPIFQRGNSLLLRDARSESFRLIDLSAGALKWQAQLPGATFLLGSTNHVWFMLRAGPQSWSSNEIRGLSLDRGNVIASFFVNACSTARAVETANAFWLSCGSQLSMFNLGTTSSASYKINDSVFAHPFAAKADAYLISVQRTGNLLQGISSTNQLYLLEENGPQKIRGLDGSGFDSLVTLDERAAILVGASKFSVIDLKTGLMLCEVQGKFKARSGETLFFVRKLQRHFEFGVYRLDTLKEETLGLLSDEEMLLRR